MKKTAKGDTGYVSYEKKKRALITLVMFAIPLTIYFSGWAYAGTRKNIMTLVAILGVLPAAKCAVNFIMIMLQKPVDSELVKRTQEKAQGLVQSYEMMVTAYEGRMPIDAMVVCGNQVVCYSSAQKGDFAFMEKHMAKILSSNGCYSVKVKIFREERAFLERVGQMAKDPEKYREGIKFTPNETYPDLSREEVIKHVLLAISV